MRNVVNKVQRKSQGRGRERNEKSIYESVL